MKKRVTNPLIKDISAEKLKDIIVSWGYNSFRANQILDEIYLKRAESFSSMSLIPKNLRKQLEKNFILNDFVIKTVRKSSDGSIKMLLTLQDGIAIETVIMPQLDNAAGETSRNTLCVSSMAGCPLSCSFCATGALGFKRNLTASEIIGQLLAAEKICGEKITNLVFMGMGEPLLNYENVLASIKILTKKQFKLLSEKRITVSTSGMLSKMYKLAGENMKIKLALSLHGTTDEQRELIMRGASASGKLSELLEAMEHYYRASKMPLTYEYILFDGVNDSANDAERLTKIFRRASSSVNIIPFNDISHTEAFRQSKIKLKPSPSEKKEAFIGILRRNGAAVNVRKSFGADIEAACGQLALSQQRSFIQ